MANRQPGGIRFGDGRQFRRRATATPPCTRSGASPTWAWSPARRGTSISPSASWDWMLTPGTGTGWFPAAPDNCNETCCISDMMSIAALIAQAGHPEYFDYVERYLRNYISNLQFIVTPEFEAYYRELNAAGERGGPSSRACRAAQVPGRHHRRLGPERLRERPAGRRIGLRDVRLLRPGGHAGDLHGLDEHHRPPAGIARSGPAGVYVNLCLSRDSPWGEVRLVHPGRRPADGQGRRAGHVLPPAAALGAARGGAWPSSAHARAGRRGRATTCASTRATRRRADDHLPAGAVHARGRAGCGRRCAPDLQMTFHWLGNMVVAADPPAKKTPLFTGRPRLLPPAP